MLGIDTRELDAMSTELSFVLGREGYKGWPGMFEIVLNSMWCTSSKTSYMLIWSDTYLRLKECCRKFWTVINSGVEDAYIKFNRRLKVSFGKTVDLKTLSTSDCWSPSLSKHLIVCSHGLSLIHCINVTVFFFLSVVPIRMESWQRRKF